MDKNKKKIIIRFLILFVIVLDCIGIWWMLTKKDSNEPEKIPEPKPLVVENADAESAELEEPVNDIDFAALQAINPDIYAWIRIPGTNIDYPILSNEEDGYYLRRSYERKDDIAGSIFTDKYNSRELTDPVTVIYGHNLTNVNQDTMFTALDNYKDETFFKEHPYIYIYLPGETLKYQVFSAVTFDDRYILSAYDFSSAEGFTGYITYLNSSIDGVVDETIQPEYGNPVISLSTCVEEFATWRWLVNGVLIERTDIE